MLTPKTCIFRVLKLVLSGPFCFHSEHSYACKELCEVPGGDQVDGSPPAPVGRPDSERRCVTLGLVLLRFERYSTGHIQKRDFHSL